MRTVTLDWPAGRADRSRRRMVWLLSWDASLRQMCLVPCATITEQRANGMLSCVDNSSATTGCPALALLPPQLRAKPLTMRACARCTQTHCTQCCHRLQLGICTVQTTPRLLRQCSAYAVVGARPLMAVPADNPMLPLPTPYAKNIKHLPSPIRNTASIPSCPHPHPPPPDVPLRRCCPTVVHQGR